MPNKDRQEEKRICEDIIRALDKPHRLIDWDKVLEWMHRQKETTEQWSMRISIENYVDEMPTVDAVEVVRCKDCESWGLNAIKKDEKGEVIYGDCLHFCCSTPKWFYCAWGERKNGQ